MKYRHVVEYATRQIWAMEESTLRRMVAILSLRVEGGRLSDDDIADRLAAARGAQGERRGRQSGVTAVIPIYGVLIPRASMFDEMSGATSVEQIRGDFRAALADDDVARIVFDVDSPGGSVEGIPELAREIRAARGTKPMQAVSNYMMASAAYYIGSQADEVIASPSAMVGSIGVYSIHASLAGAYEQAGIEPQLVKAGKFKAEWNDMGPLSAEALAHLQESVDYSYDLFVGDVAAARGVSKAAVRDGYGQGRGLDPGPAKAADLVDRIATLEEVLAGKAPKMRDAGRSSVLDTAAEQQAASLAAARAFLATGPDAAAIGRAIDAIEAEPLSQLVASDALGELRRARFAFERERRARQGLRPAS